MTKKINLLDSLSEKQKFITPQPKNRKPALAIIYVFIFLLITFFVFKINLNKSEQPTVSWLAKIPIIGKHLAESADSLLKGEEYGQINILLLGIGGEDHQGGMLTDTIMLACLQPKTEKVALVSIPRDLVVPIENLGWRKINNVNALAEAKKPGSGGLAVSQTISDLLSVPIDYYIRVDFQAFREIIDELGGIKIYVENTLDDYSFPVAGEEEAPYDQRYEHLHIDQGWQEMDGQLALKYARSRHAAGSEGSDFARARRQQQILAAIKDKVLSLHILFKPTKIINIANQIQENFQTNLKIWEMVKLWNWLKEVKNENIITRVIDNSPEGLLVSTITSDGAYILLPRGGDFTKIQYLVNNIFAEAPVQDKTKINQEKASLEVRNGTWINGLASKVALDLEKYGFKVVRVGNSSQQNFQKSVIYDLTYGEKIQSLTVLKDLTGANVALGLPEWLKADLAGELAGEINPIQPDFIIILGQEADKTKSGAENLVE